LSDTPLLIVMSDRTTMDYDRPKRQLRLPDRANRKDLSPKLSMPPLPLPPPPTEEGKAAPHTLTPTIGENKRFSWLRKYRGNPEAAVIVTPLEHVAGETPGGQPFDPSNADPAVPEAADRECPIKPPSPLDAFDGCPDIARADFNVLQVGKTSHLRMVVLQAFLELVDLSTVCLPQGVLREYIREVSSNYKPNPFHNFHHATSVVHFMHIMIKTTAVGSRLTQLNKFSFLVSALTHDVDHPGNTNLFEINTVSELAVLYNDVSVLENHHCSMTFRLMNRSGANILSRLPTDQRIEARKSIINCIMATDMSKHSEVIEQGNKHVEIGTKLELDTADMLLIGRLFLHAADLSGPAKEYSVARAWARCVTEEFNAQNELEVSMGLPSLSFMARCNEVNFLKNEIGFSGFFVAPLWRVVSKICPELEFMTEQLEQNVSRYKSLQEDYEKKSYYSAMHATSKSASSSLQKLSLL
jgi:hypothetical protein